MSVCSTAAVQNTGLVMQWCPVQLPSWLWILESREDIRSFHVSHSLPPAMTNYSLVCR